jgi:hypothetical protein
LLLLSPSSELISQISNAGKEVRSVERLAPPVGAGAAMELLGAVLRRGQNPTVYRLTCNGCPSNPKILFHELIHSASLYMIRICASVEVFTWEQSLVLRRIAEECYAQAFENGHEL